MKYKIVVDSCCDLTEEMKSWNNLEVVPMTLQIADYVIQDDKNFNQDDFVRRMLESDVLAQSACPSPQAFANACKGDYESVFIITITSELSGSYNSAVQGAQMFSEENDSNTKVHVFNSLATSGLESLIAMEIKKLGDDGKGFDEIIAHIDDFIENRSQLYFCLETFDILKGNGRLFNLAANVIEALKVKIIGRAVDGKVSIAGKDLTQKRAFVKLSHMIDKDTGDSDLSDKLCIISHVCCEEKANTIKELVVSNTRFTEDNVMVIKASGLNTLYAANGGTLIAFNY